MSRFVVAPAGCLLFLVLPHVQVWLRSTFEIFGLFVFILFFNARPRRDLDTEVDVVDKREGSCRKLQRIAMLRFYFVCSCILSFLSSSVISSPNEISVIVFRSALFAVSSEAKKFGCNLFDASRTCLIFQYVSLNSSNFLCCFSLLKKKHQVYLFLFQFCFALGESRD